MIARLCAAAFLAGTLAGPRALVALAAPAKTQKDVPYAQEAVLPAALRFLRVDLKLKVKEVDKDAGYLLFDYVEEKKPSREASLELVKMVAEDGRDTTRMELSIADTPRYVQTQLLERLARKLADQLGEPPKPRKPVEKKPAPPDAAPEIPREIPLP